MTPKQERFVQEYLIDLNATQAAIRAGYAPKAAEQQGHVLLRNPKLAVVIAERQEKTATKAGITRERVLRETELLAHSNVDHYMLDETGRLVIAPGAPPDAMQAVSSIKYKVTTYGTGENARTERTCEFKLWDKPGSIKLAGRHVDVHGFWERVELTGKDGSSLADVMQMAISLADKKQAG